MTAVTRFNRAIVRRPARSVTQGLRAVDLGAPTFDGVSREHEAYCAALRDAGVELTVLEPMEEFPDSIFVEDPALVFEEGAILLNPGAESRAGETPAIEADIRAHFDNVLSIDQGTVEGGDVLVTPRAVLIGLSERTNHAGANALIAALETLGRKGEIFHTPPGVLHFKSDCSLLDDETVLATSRLADSPAFDGMIVVETPEGEEAAANALRVNDVVMLGEDFPGTRELLQAKGYEVVSLPTAEIGKIDAGLSCMSLRWWKSSTST
ncbi:MAG: arginine deiminase family protein [Pseudomonadota bacterium]